MRLHQHWRTEDGVRLPMALWRPGPRSVWGARIARAVHAAVQAGAAGYAATLNGRTQ